MLLKAWFFARLTILSLGLVSGHYYNGRLSNGTSGCVIPRDSDIANVTLEQMYRYGGGFIKSIVNFPPKQETDRKCLTVDMHRLDGGVLHVVYTSEKITTSERVEELYLAIEVRPGVYKALSATYGSNVVVMKYVLAHHPDWTVCTGCLYKDGKFVAQSSSILSKTRILHPFKQLEIYRNSAKVDVYRSMEVSQFYCHYNDDFETFKRGK